MGIKRDIICKVLKVLPDTKSVPWKWLLLTRMAILSLGYTAESLGELEKLLDALVSTTDN